MIDHAPRIRALQQQQSEQEAINDLERRSAPLLWAVYFAVAIITLALAADGVHTHFKRYTDLGAEEEALVQCMNGKLIAFGSTFVTCQSHEIKLVQGGDK